MALGFGSAKDEDVLTLIAKKNYAKAIEILKRGKADARTKMILADVLVLAGKNREAVAVLAPLADEYAREGFAAKAVAVFKKIQKIDPTRRDVEQKLASLIQEKQRVATVLPLSPSRGEMPEMGMEEIGMEGPGFEMGMEAGPALSFARPAPSPEPMPASLPFVPVAPVAVAPMAPAPVAPKAPVVEPLPFADEPLLLDSVAVSEAAPLPVAPTPAVPSPAPPPAKIAAALFDPDFFTDDDLRLDEAEGEGVSAEPMIEAEMAVEAEITLEPEASGDPMSDSRFAEELMGLVDNLFDAPTGGGDDALPASEAGQQIVVSPLFQHFSVDEMVAVIAGLNLLIFERGDVIIRQGQPGNSLYMLTSGKVRAFVKTAAGKNTPVADLSEGAFFGEGSILTGKPRSATVAALTACELLELDRPTLDDIASRHPHVMDVLREFAARRIK